MTIDDGDSDNDGDYNNGKGGFMLNNQNDGRGVGVL
jgi:hypothetical protein